MTCFTFIQACDLQHALLYVMIFLMLACLHFFSIEPLHVYVLHVISLYVIYDIFRLYPCV